MIIFANLNKSNAKEGNQGYKVEVGSADTDYVLIIYGFDAAITTGAQTVEFRTLAQ